MRIDYRDSIAVDYLPFHLYQPVTVTPRPMQLVSASHNAAGAVVTEPVQLSQPVGRMVAVAPGALGSVVAPAIRGTTPAAVRADLSALMGGTLTVKPALQRALTHYLRVPTHIPGSYTLRVSASGVDPEARCRFERYLIRCFVVE